MKRILICLILLNFLPPLICKGYEPVTGEDKEVRTTTSESSTKTVKKADRTERQVRVRQHRSRASSDWREGYYAHKYRLPWWPGEPGS